MRGGGRGGLESGGGNLYCTCTVEIPTVLMRGGGGIKKGKRKEQLFCFNLFLLLIKSTYFYLPVQKGSGLILFVFVYWR